MRASTPETILYLNMIPGDLVKERLLAGIRRYARGRGWEVEAVREAASRPRMIPELIANKHPVGCIVQCGRDVVLPPLRSFGNVPAVFLGADDASRSDFVNRVVFDEEAVARTAFRELSAGKPEAYATVIFRQPRTWSLAREAAFRTLVATSGRPCLSFRGHWPKREKPSVRAARFAKWLTALPRKCAVFAMNDDSAMEVVAAARSVGRRIPQDITLLGVDNDVSICEASRPTISSIQMDFENAGFLAARMLAERRSASIDVGPLLPVRRESTRGRGRREPLILEAVETIRREACDGLTVRALIDRFPGSRRLFELRFREAMGYSVLDEIQNIRLQKVYTLLARTDTAIGAIAGLCGYRTDIALRKLFRAREGMSMQEWRRRNGR